MKVITICGSLSFAKEMTDKAYALELAGNCVLLPIISGRKNAEGFSAQELEALAKAHEKKIDLADEVYIMNVGGYIGESTKRELAYAMKLGKKISYFI